MVVVALVTGGGGRTSFVNACAGADILPTSSCGDEHTVLPVVVDLSGAPGAMPVLSLPGSLCETLRALQQEQQQEQQHEWAVLQAAPICGAEAICARLKIANGIVLRALLDDGKSERLMALENAARVTVPKPEWLDRPLQLVDSLSVQRALPEKARSSLAQLANQVDARIAIGGANAPQLAEGSGCGTMRVLALPSWELDAAAKAAVNELAACSIETSSEANSCSPQLVAEVVVDTEYAKAGQYLAVLKQGGDGWSECRAGLVPTLSLGKPSSLHMACYQGIGEAVELLLAEGADVRARAGDARATALHVASLWGHEGIAKLLLAKGAEVGAQNADGAMPLHVASSAGVARLLLDSGAEVNASVSVEKLTPLHVASRSGRGDVARELLDSGAEVDARAVEELTPLHMASHMGHEDVVALLVDRGAEVDARQEAGWTALFYACLGGHPDVAKLLLDKGADVNARAKEDWTPLHLASVSGHEGVAELLLDHGADLDAREAIDRETPLDMATANGHEGVVEVLLRSYSR